jgi:type IV pilus assembly protein PilA
MKAKNQRNKITNGDGFTLIELLIVIAIIGILAAIIFVTLNPLARFMDSRDAVRREEAYMLVNAIKLDQLDHGGHYMDQIDSMNIGEVYMITKGVVISGCADQNTYCDTTVSNDGHCVDLQDLVTRGYMGDIPVSKNGEGNWSYSETGYTLQKDITGVVTVRSCESENTGEIWVAR